MSGVKFNFFLATWREELIERILRQHLKENIMKKFDFKTFALSCLALGLLFSTPSVYGSEDDDDDGYMFLAGGSCGAPGGKGGCGGAPSQPNGNGNDGSGPVRPMDPNAPQSGHSCSGGRVASTGSVDAAKRADLI